MSNRIVLGSTGSTENSELCANAIRRLRDALDDLTNVADIGAQCINGADYTDLEAEFGLQTGEGSAFYTLLTGVTGANLTPVDNLTSRIGRR